MARSDDDAIVAIVAIGALLAALWLGSKKKCPYCQTENDKATTNCRNCGANI